MTLDEVRSFYQQFYGPGDGEIVLSGQFDPEQMRKLVTELFGDWKSPSRYQRVPDSYAKVDAVNHKIETPDKQNGLFLAGMPLKMKDTDPDYPALTIAGMVFGGTPNSRLFRRIRVKDGLSYGAGAQFQIPTEDDSAVLSGFAIAAPQNMPKVEADFNEELALALKDGFTADEVEKAKKTWLDERTVQRSEEGSIASLLISSRVLGPHHAVGCEARSSRRRANPTASQRCLQTSRRSRHLHHRQRRRLQKSRRLPTATIRRRQLIGPIT